MSNNSTMSPAFEREKNIKAATYTTVICVLLFIIFFFVKWTLPQITPPVFEEGIEVNLGNSDEGLGDVAPEILGDPSNAPEEEYTPPAQSSAAPPVAQEENITGDENEADDAPVVNNHFMKPLLLVILVFVALYTYTKKNFGTHTEKDHSFNIQLLYSIIASIVLGFYDGFIGPGTGSFLVLAFITLLGFDFLKASAHAKLINLSTNLGSILFFAASGRIIFAIAIPMAICNAIGGSLGARLAIAKGNKFIRIFFLVIVVGTILRFAYDVFFRHP